MNFWLSIKFGTPASSKFHYFFKNFISAGSSDKNVWVYSDIHSIGAVVAQLFKRFLQKSENVFFCAAIVKCRSKKKIYSKVFFLLFCSTWKLVTILILDLILWSRKFRQHVGNFWEKMKGFFLLWIVLSRSFWAKDKYQINFALFFCRYS